MSDWMASYAETDDLNRKYQLLRAEATRLRGRREEVEFFDDEAVNADVRRLNETVDGDLVVFVANDFGLPRAYRPTGTPIGVQDEIRQAILRGKYDDTNDDLDDVRRELLDAHPGVHKAIVATYADDEIRYHLPEGASETTNFLTVREMVGLVDYTTNSAQSAGLSGTY